MSDTLIRVADPRLIQSGIVKSLNPLQTPLWLEGSNVIFEDGMVRKGRGFAAAFSSVGVNPVRGIKALNDAGINRMAWGDYQKLYDWSGASVNSSTTTFSGQKDESSTAPATSWSLETWGSWMVAANGLAGDNFYVNKFVGAGWVQVTGTDVPTRIRKLLRRGPFLLALNTDEGGQMLEWCDIDDIEDWDRSASPTEAGSLFIRDLDSEIQDAARLGQAVLAYSDNQCVQINLIGSPNWFGYVPLFEGIGAVSNQCVVAANQRHYGRSKTGFWETDGASFNYISPPFLRIWLEKNANKNQISKTCGWWDSDRSMICWSFPTSTDENDITIGFNYETKTWTFFPYGRTAGFHKGVFDYPVAGAPDGSVFYHNFGVDADGEAAAASVRTRPLDLGDSSVWKYVDSLKIMLHELAGNVTVRVGTQQYVDDAISWQPAQSLDDGFENLYDRVETKFLVLEIASTESSADWAVSGFELFGRAEGRED